MATSNSLEANREFAANPNPTQKLPSNKTIVSQMNVTHVNIQNTNIDPVAERDLTRLLDHTCVAAYENSDTYDSLKCYPGTREVLLDRLDTWMNTPLEERTAFMWLDGPMGSGKSAAARSIAERMSLKNRLLGMYIFRRGEGGRGNSSQFVTTLAYQMAFSIPAIRPLIASQILHDPSILQQSISRQLDVLVIEPLRQLHKNSDHDVKSLANVIIVDGLDECGDDTDLDGRQGEQLRLLDLLYRLTLYSDILPFAIFVASRPEIHLKSWFRMEAHSGATYRTTLDSTYKPNDDIRFFVTQSFLKLRESHPLRHHLPPSWPLQPGEEEHQLSTKPTADNICVCKVVEDIVRTSSGQFILPSVVMKFIASPRYQPHQRLEHIMRRNDNNTDPNTPEAILDNLYHQVLDATADHEVTLKVLMYSCWNPFGEIRLPRAIPLLRILSALQISKAEFDHCIEQLESLATCTFRSESFLHFHHTSLFGFLRERKRSKQWCVLDSPRLLRVADQALKLFKEEHFEANGYAPWREFAPITKRSYDLWPSFLTLRGRRIAMPLRAFSDKSL
ncbi:hypothetical protein CVT24_009965 [Panaeolus cyanescens]|uniref:Nephrocystin 3-like N-terminal domain-containing protein n=1 Tax=Panaeolus cyanescens TaxID=181874 RepID=A0A409VXG7_9AGAR|nr:hypothetical protein CVT24_009965 [Panaeolus cyanescens]